MSQFNIGIEMRAFDWLTVNADYFDRVTNDMKTRPVIPDYIGNDPSTANVGSMLNRLILNWVMTALSTKISDSLRALT